MSNEVYQVDEMDVESWPNWTDEVSFTASDASEAVLIFSELAEDEIQAEFDCFVSNLCDQDYVDFRRAVDDIRRVLRNAWEPLRLETLIGVLDIH